MISSNPQNNAVAAVPSRAATVDPLAERDFAVASSLPTHDPEAVNASLPPIPAANPAHRAFSPAMTVYIVATVASIAFLGPLGANIYIPALPILSEAFNESIKTINLTLSIYLIAQGLTPMIWASTADAIGRRPVLIAALSFYIAACIGLALVPTSSFGGLMALRLLQATGGACTYALGAGVLGDITEPHERGSFFAWYQLGVMLGPAIGPVLGGILAQYLGWRAIFWLLVISSAVLFVPLVFTFPETLRTLVGSGDRRPPALNMTVVALLRRRRATLESSASELEAKPDECQKTPTMPFRERWRLIQPFDSLKLILHPDVFLLLWCNACSYAAFYCVLTAASSLFKSRYDLNEIEIGLTYLANGGGCLVGSFAIGRVLDYDFRRLKKTMPPDTPIHLFPLEHARLRWTPLLFTLFILANIGFGWSIEANAHIAVPIICEFFIGACGTPLMSIASTVLIDLQPGKGSSITASNNFARCLFGAAGTAAIEPMIQRLGAGWAFVVIAGICLAFAWMPLVILHKGPRWRRERAEAAEEKLAR